MTALLAVDTASPSFLAVAFGAGDSAMVIDQVEAPRDQSRQLLAGIERVLCGQRPDAIVVVTGPGSFAGLRVGIASARGISTGLGIRLYGVPTLDAVGAACAELEPLTVTHPMGRDMLAVRSSPEGPVRIVPAESLTDHLGLIAGEGATSFGGREITAGERCAAALRLVAEDLAAGRTPGTPVALYFREPNITKPRQIA